MNSIALTGNCVKDIELKFSPSGTGIANGTIAVRRDFRNKQGEYETDFINFVAIGKISQVMADYIKKGDKFGITGRLQIRKYNDKYYTEVVVNSFDFPDKKKQDKPKQDKPTQKIDHDPFDSQGQINIQDDDLPF